MNEGEVKATSLSNYSGRKKKMAQAKLWSGGRFSALKKKLSAKGAKSPGALASFIGMKKYGKKKFQAEAAKARARAIKGGK